MVVCDRILNMLFGLDPQMGYVYSLNDPDTSEIRYVGKTQFPLERRLKEHLFKAGNNPKTHRDWWIRSIVKQGKIPLIQVLDMVPVDELDNSEKDWIKNLRMLDCRLTNMTDGGEGGDTGQIPPVRSGEANNKAKLTEERVTWLRQQAKAGRDIAELGRELGVTPQAAWYAATGRTWKMVTEEPIRQEARQKLTSEQVDEIRTLTINGASRTSLATRFCVSPSHISDIVLGKKRLVRQLS